MKKNKVLLIFSALFLLLLSLNVFGALNDNLLSYYSFEEQTGLTLFDSLNKNNLTNTNSVIINQSGKIGQSAQFSNANNYFYTATATGYPAGNINFSVFTWAYETSCSGNYPTIMTYGTESTGTGIQLNLNANDCLIAFDNYGQNYLKTSQAFGLNAWHHIGFTLDGTNLRIYYDGVNVGNKTDITGINVPINSQLRIGTPWATQYIWTGKIDEMGIWNRTLTQTEVTQLYNSGNGLSYTDIAPTPIIFTYTKTCFFNGTGLSLNLMSGCY
jgi:hypothetical protein